MGSNGWYTGDVTVSWAVVDNESAVTSRTGCSVLTISADTAGTTLTCSATSAGGASSVPVTIKIDKTAPACSASAAPDTLLWSPNHKLVDITNSVGVTDSGGSGGAGFKLLSVSSSEADAGLGFDDLPNDIQGWALNTPDITGQLRSERYSKAGRTYTFTYQASDQAGNTGNCSAVVTVSHSQKK